MTTKVKIPYARKKDLEIINEQVFKIMQKTSDEIDQKKLQFNHNDYKIFKKTVDRRIQQFIGSVHVNFNDNVQYCRTTNKKNHKVISEPDKNLKKIIQVQTQMLKNSQNILRLEECEKVKIKLIPQNVKDLKIYNNNQYEESVSEYCEKKVKKFPNHLKVEQKIKSYEDMLQRMSKIILNRANKQYLEQFEK